MTAKTSVNLIITCVRQQAREIRSFDLLPAAAKASHDIAFRPGQVAILGVDGHEPAYFAFAGCARRSRSWKFSLSGRSGASVALFEMKEGDAVDLLGVAGHGFDLNGQAGRDCSLRRHGNRSGAAAFGASVMFSNAAKSLAS